MDLYVAPTRAAYPYNFNNGNVNDESTQSLCRLLALQLLRNNIP